MSDGDAGEGQPQAGQVVDYAPASDVAPPMVASAAPLSADSEEIGAVLPPIATETADSAAPSHPGLSVSFRNSYPANAKVAVMRYDLGACGEHGNWATAGWWRLEPGQEVFAFFTNNRYMCFYAVAEDGLVWSGQYGPVFVREEDFESCIAIQPEDPCQSVGMLLVDLGSVGAIINLTQA